ncbi:DUF6063 family protein [Fredinandcohnia humi]
MFASDADSRANKLFRYLVERGYIEKNHEMAIDYSEDEVRLKLERMARDFGTDIFDSGNHIHLVALPEESMFATSFSHAMEHSGTSIDKIAWYLIGVIQNIFCWEIDNEYIHRLSVEREGVTYHQLEEMTTKVLEGWKDINDQTNGAFSLDFKLAVEKMGKRWNEMSSKRPKTGRYSIHTRLGLIHKAMSIFKEGKLVHISTSHKVATIVYPTDILYERLEYIFQNLDRYLMIKDLLNDQLEEYVLERTERQALLLDEEEEGTA